MSNQSVSSLKLWFLRHKKKIAEIGTGAILYGIFNWVFNYPLYLGVIGWLGLVKGGALMTLLSFIQCMVLLFVFDKMGIDWVGIGYVDNVVKKENKNRVEKMLVWAVRKEHQGAVGKLVKLSGFAVMSILVDPFVIAVHYRREQFKGVTWRDVRILIGAVFFGNIYWIARQGILVVIAKEIWKRI